MSITYPLSVASFVGKYRIAMITLDLQFQQQLSNQASGGIIGKDLGPAFWTAEIKTSMLNDSDFEEVLALLRALEGAQGTFLCTNSRRQYPKLDPTGSTLGTNTVTVSSASPTQIALQGLPVGYTISLADYLSLDFGSPTEHALFQSVETATANGSGITPLFEVRPAVPAAVALGNPVSLKLPTVQMCVQPGSIKRSDNFLFSSLSFTGMESMGA